MDLDTFIRIADEGSTPLILALGWAMWKIHGLLSAFIVEIRAQQRSRDEKINQLSTDVNAMIRKMADMNGGDGQ